METKFVKTFLKPQTVVHQRSKKSLGVCEGAAGFGYYYATMRDGSVTLYDYNGKVLYDQLGDAWVAPNGYRLITRKNSALWELFTSTGKKHDEGDHVKVLSKDRYTLLFLKQCESDVWHLYDLSENSFSPNVREYVAEDIEAFYLKGLNENRLIFAMLQNGVYTLKGINQLYLRPKDDEWAGNVPFFEILPGGCIAVSQEDISRLIIKTKTFVFWRVSSENEPPLKMYSQKLRLEDNVKGFAIFHSGVKLYLSADDKFWSIIGADGRRLMPYKILHLNSDLCHESLTGYIDTGLPCTFSAVLPNILRFDIDGKPQSFIVDGRRLYDAESCSDLCII